MSLADDFATADRADARIAAGEQPEAVYAELKLAGRGQVQFNQRVKPRVADGFRALARQTERPVAELLEEALALLLERHGRDAPR